MSVDTPPMAGASLVELLLEPAPIRVFMVWHPKFGGGESLFRAVYEWLGGPTRDMFRRGLGVPVHPWSGDDPETPPPLPPTCAGTLTVIVAILDGELLGRTRWRRWFFDLQSRGSAVGGRLVVLPWAEHHAAAQVPGIGVLHMLGSGACDPEQLRRRVTEACVIRVRDEATPRPLRLFVSYARKDGSEVAREVRQALQAYGHLSVFFDEHDLQPGARWRDGLAAELNRGAAMFAVVTDAYASRAWCREELRRFREPRREGRTNRWWLRPVFILDHLSGAATRSMFEVGSASAARWSPGRAREVADELVREVLFAEVNRERAAGVQGPSDVQIINWAPDTWTLLQVLRLLPHAERHRVAYPGDGLPKVELDRLTRALPGVELYSFEELRRGLPVRAPEERRRRQRRRGGRRPVLLAISDPPRADLDRIGFHPLHLDDAAVRIARTILYEGLDVMYGGRPRDGFTEGFQDDSGTVVVEARLINHVGWPFTQKLTPIDVADGFGVTRYVAVRWPFEGGADPGDPVSLARAATYTRQRAVEGGLRDLDEAEVPAPLGIVALGGQLDGFSGFMPGVAEEVALAREAGLATYVLGGFGGAAAAVARLIEGDRAENLTRAAFLANPKYARLEAASLAAGCEAELDDRIAWLRSVLSGSELNNGLSKSENRELLRTVDLGRAVALVGQGLRRMAST